MTTITEGTLAKLSGNNIAHELHHDFLTHGYKYNEENDSYKKSLPHSDVEVFANDGHYTVTPNTSDETKNLPFHSSSIHDIETSALLHSGTPAQMVTNIHSKNNSKPMQKELVSSAIQKSQSIDDIQHVVSHIKHDNSLFYTALSELNDKKDEFNEDDFSKIRNTIGDNEVQFPLKNSYSTKQYIDSLEAKSIKTSPSRLHQLSHSVPLDVLRNPNTSSDTINDIWHHNPEYAASHNNLTRETLHKIITSPNTNDFAIREITKRNDLTDDDRKAIVSLPHHKGYSSSLTMLHNPETSSEVVKHIFDTHEGLQKLASKHPNGADLSFKRKKDNNKTVVEHDPVLKKSITDMFHEKYRKQ